MPRFARLFEAAADTLNAYYQAVTDANLDALMVLWIDEDFASCISADGAGLLGLEQIRSGHATRLAAQPVTIEPLNIRVYDSLGTVIYTVTELHRYANLNVEPLLVLATYVMIHERGEWRIAHIHASAVSDQAASQFTNQLRHGQGPLH